MNLFAFFQRDSSSAARELSKLGHYQRRMNVRARCDQMRADMGMEPAKWPK